MRLRISTKEQSDCKPLLKDRPARGEPRERKRTMECKVQRCNNRKDRQELQALGQGPHQIKPSQQVHELPASELVRINEVTHSGPNQWSCFLLTETTALDLNKSRLKYTLAVLIPGTAGCILLYLHGNMSLSFEGFKMKINIIYHFTEVYQ